MKAKYNKFINAYMKVINESNGQPVDDEYYEEDDEDTIQYAILDIETGEIEELGDDPVELMQEIDCNEQDGIWEYGKYGVYERYGEDGEWEISEVIGTPGGGWK